MLLVPGFVLRLNDDVRGGEGFLNVSLAKNHFVEQVSAAFGRARRRDDRRVRLQRLQRIEDPGQGLVVHANLPRSSAGCPTRRCRDQSHRLSHVAYDVRCKSGLIVIDHVHDVLPGNVLRGNGTGDIGFHERGREIDPADSGVRMGAAHHGHVEHPREGKIVHVPRLPTDLVHSVGAGDPHSDQRRPLVAHARVGLPSSGS